MTRLVMYSDPKQFWEKRLKEHFDLVGSGFASLGPIYNARIYKARLDAFEKTIATIGIKIKGEKILEIGCGTGFFTGYCWKQNVDSYTGVDITEISVNNLAEKYPDFTFIQADIGDPAIRLNQQFGLILAADVLYHIVDDEQFSIAIKNISELLRTDCYFIASDLFTTFTVDAGRHWKMRSIGDYSALLEQYDLKILHIEPMFALLNPPVFSPHSSLIWNFYALAWQYILHRLAKWRWFDRYISTFLARLDKSYFLSRVSANTPNSKWLIAVKTHVD
jgi:SAM-dependent methyltransferase